MMDYIVVEADDKVAFTTQVRSALATGWKCEGGVFAQQVVTEGSPVEYLWTHYAQAMVRNG